MSHLTVLIIRHGEKPEGSGSGPGLTEAGEVEERSLTIRGWQRAGAWAALFGSGPEGGSYPVPTALFAADPDRSSFGAPSRRQLQTVRPLAARLGLVPVTRHAKGEEGRLARELDGMTGVILVCWEHKLIAETLLPALLGPAPPPGTPRRWDPARFDVVLRLDRIAPGGPWTLRQLFPRLVAGDTDEPL